MQPRYQIFISSTFKDLEKEREAVLKAVLELQHFPSGMELFMASNSTPWEMIEKLIEECDYYVLIIGGKYGSMDEQGISFTEREYNLAVNLGKHVLAFPHADPDNIPSGKSESDPSIRDKLESFKRKVQKHMLRTYRTPEDLRGHVLASLAIAFQKHPQTGWVKASGVASSDLMEKLIAAQESNARLQKENAELRTNLHRPAAELSFGKIRVNFDLKKYSCRVTIHNLSKSVPAENVSVRIIASLVEGIFRPDYDPFNTCELSPDSGSRTINPGSAADFTFPEDEWHYLIRGIGQLLFNEKPDLVQTFRLNISALNSPAIESEFVFQVDRKNETVKISPVTDALEGPADQLNER